MMDIGTVLRGLYASGSDGGVRWWRVGIYWWLGSMEIADARGVALTLDDAFQAMHEAALKHYPDSAYAKKAKEATPPARVLTPEMMEAVKDALAVLPDPLGHNPKGKIATQLRAAFGIEEG